MKNTVKAKISWIPASAGGRKRLPRGPIYSTVASFEDDWGQSPLSWSIIAEFLQAPDPKSGCTLANIRFLAPNAPLALLHPGSRFQLFEGPRLVATGEVSRERVEPQAERQELVFA